MFADVDEPYRDQLATRAPFEASHARSSLIAISAVVVIIVVAAPSWGFMSDRGGAVLDTLSAGSMLLATIVAGMRFGTAPSRAARALLIALAFLTTSMFLLVTIPAVVGVSPRSSLDSALDVSALLGTTLLASAAFARDIPLTGISAKWLSVTAVTMICLSATAVVATIGVVWPALDLHPAGAGLEHVASRSLCLTLCHGLTAALTVVAALGFAWRAPRLPFPHFASWLAISAALTGASLLDNLLAPAQSTSTVSLSDVLSALSALVLGIGAVREFQCARQRERQVVLREERRRLARDLHDSVVQELAFIVGQSRRLAEELPEERGLADIGSAATHALAGSRSILYGLQTPSSYGLADTLRARAHELASRSGLRPVVEIEGDVDASAHVTHAVLWIVQEAISNAVRHADASTLEVSLRARGEGLEVRVSDDGHGFEPLWTVPSQAGGFGLWSMYERSLELGGELRVHSMPGLGTTVEAVFPRALSSGRGSSPGTRSVSSLSASSTTRYEATSRSPSSTASHEATSPLSSSTTRREASGSPHSLVSVRRRYQRCRISAEGNSFPVRV